MVKCGKVEFEKVLEEIKNIMRLDKIILNKIFLTLKYFKYDNYL